MLRRVVYLAVVLGLVGILGGCALTFFNFEPRAAWRDAEERACIGNRSELAAVNYTPLKRIDGRGACGIYAPIKVASFDNSGVAFSTPPTLGCPLTAALDAWMMASVQPAAIAWFGVPVVEVQQMDNYSCRTVDNIPGENLSEHSFGNAIDIAGYKLADGRLITVRKDFRLGETRARGFLHEIFAAACAQFKTVLGPGEPYHEDHFHLDLAHHNAAGTTRYCNPKPDVTVPERPPYGGPALASGPVLSTIRGILGIDRGTTGSVGGGN
jgi:hypothetical protein